MLHLTTLLSTRGSQVLAGLGAVALLLVGVSGCGGGSSADHPAVQPTPTLGPIAATVSLPPRSSAPMALYDSTLVWVGAGRNAGSCPRFRVYRADLRRFQPRVLWTGPPCWSVSDIRISRSWIVWMAGEDPAGSIWAMHRWGGRRYPIAQQHFQPWQHPCLDLSCTPGASFSLDGNLLVWSHFVFGREPDSITSSIRARVLPFGHIRTLFQSHVPCEMQIDPQVSNGRLVWVKARWPRDVSLAEVPSQQCEGQLQTNVMTRRLTGPVKQVTVDGQSTQPETNGRFIIWTTPAPDPICACSSLHLMDTFRGLLLEPAREIASARILPRAVVWLSVSQPPRLFSLRLPVRRRLRPRLLLGTSGQTMESFVRALGWPSAMRLVLERDVVRGPTQTSVEVKTERVT